MAHRAAAPSRPAVHRFAARARALPACGAQPHAAPEASRPRGGVGRHHAPGAARTPAGHARPGSAPRRVRAAASSPRDMDFASFGLLVSREYAVTLQRDQPLGVLFVARGDAIVVVEVQPGSQAEASGLIFVGDVLKRTSAVFGEGLWPASDFRRTMSAIQQRRGDDICFVLERPARSAAEQRKPPEEPACEAVGGGRSGAVWSVGAGAMGLVSFSLDAGCIVDASPPPPPARVAPLPRAPAPPIVVSAADGWVVELAEAKSRSLRVHPRLLVLSAPVSARALALLCADANAGGVLSLLQPYEHGRGSAVAQAAAAAAGARRVCQPLPDATRAYVAAALPAAAGAVARLADWAGAARGVLVTASDPLDMAAPTVAAAVLHWHWGATLAEAAAAVPTADLSLIERAAADMLAALHPEAAGEALQLYRVRFSWRGKATRVALAGDPSGGWTAEGGLALSAVEGSGVEGGEREWAVELTLPRGVYDFKFVADGTRWLVGASHDVAADSRGNRNNRLEAGAIGAGHVPASAAEAAAWAASAHRLALVRGAAAAAAAALDESSLLSAAQREAPSGGRSAAEVVAAASATAAAVRSGAAPQLLR